MLSRLYDPATGGHKSDGTLPIPQLSSFTTLFFAHALRALYSPASSLYPLTSRFLLQRPDFDPLDPPMLYSMLYSTLEGHSGSKEGNWKRERSWMLKFLADGMRGSRDWAVLQRRHTWDLLASTFQANRHDRVITFGISKVSTLILIILIFTLSLIILTTDSLKVIAKQSCRYKSDRSKQPFLLVGNPSPASGGHTFRRHPPENVVSNSGESFGLNGSRQN